MGAERRASEIRDRARLDPVMTVFLKLVDAQSWQELAVTRSDAAAAPVGALRPGAGRTRARGLFLKRAGVLHADAAILRATRRLRRSDHAAGPSGEQGARVTIGRSPDAAGSAAVDATTGLSSRDDGQVIGETRCGLELAIRAQPARSAARHRRRRVTADRVRRRVVSRGRLPSCARTGATRRPSCTRSRAGHRCPAIRVCCSIAAATPRLLGLPCSRCCAATPAYGTDADRYSHPVGSADQRGSREPVPARAGGGARLRRSARAAGPPAGSAGRHDEAAGEIEKRARSPSRAA